MKFELSKEFVARFQQALDERDQTFILQSLEDVNPADISALLYEFNSEESKYVMDLLSLDVQAEIVRDLDPVTRVNFLKIYEPGQVITLINLLNSDDAADILNELPIKVREEVLHGLDSELRVQVIDLLRYE